MSSSYDWCRYESEIAEYIRRINHDTSIHFDYPQIENLMKLKIITINSSHSGKFIFYESKLESSEKSVLLKEALEYIDKIKQNQLMTYKFTWYKQGKTTRHVSHFYGESWEEVSSKFSAINPGYYKVWSVELMPES